MLSVFQSNRPALRHVRLGLTCVAIAANAICAGGIYMFPLISPALVTHLRLTQPQLTTIVLAGMMAQYCFAVLVGKAVDKFGPSTCSLIAGLWFFFGFGLFAHEIAGTPDDTSQTSAQAAYRLTVYFFMAGLGTVFSCFSIVFAAAKNFPEFIGVASSTSMTLFGSSPVFLSFIASNFFTDPKTGLDVTSFLTHLAILCGCVHALGACTLSVPSAVLEVKPQPASEDTEQNAEVDEHTVLLPGKPTDAELQVVPPALEGSTVDLIKDSNFLILLFISFVVLGSCEMVMSNMGTIVLSLPASSSLAGSPAAELAVSTQVKILSIANTVSRLLVGPLADFVSPAPSTLPSGIRCFSRKHHISRVVFLSAASGLLAITYLWVVLVVRSQQAMWVLSVGTGIVYGCTFTMLPGMIASIWGLANAGRNFGIVNYGPFLGTPFFSYLYAFVAARQADEGGVCLGDGCWQLTFRLSFGVISIAFLSTIWLWRTWKGRI